MSMHKIELTQLERAGLERHHLAVGSPSQLSDCFRLGVKWAQENAPQPEWVSINTPPHNNDDVFCKKESGFKQIDYYQFGRFQMSNDYTHWMVMPK
jgi:hypothetical protein